MFEKDFVEDDSRATSLARVDSFSDVSCESAEPAAADAVT